MNIKKAGKRAAVAGVTAILILGLVPSSANAATSRWLTSGEYWYGSTNGVRWSALIDEPHRVQVAEDFAVTGSIGCRILRSDDTISSFLWGATYAGWSSTSKTIEAYQVSH